MFSIHAESREDTWKAYSNMMLDVFMTGENPETNYTYMPLILRA